VATVVDLLNNTFREFDAGIMHHYQYTNVVVINLYQATRMATALVLLWIRYQATSMVNTGITVDDDVLDEFDELVWQKKTEGEIPRDASRSQVIQMIMEDWIEENSEGNSNPQKMAMPVK